ncbi:MAG: Glycosyltransferases involved in cell wall biogenesis [Marinobacter excellens HL-55]|uniref:Glycosyltransferases involved in cell wall biogenesis n=1 Tax=Marinobacter excellens HL-55 TaxID=1305731 RepID=A0A0P7Y9Y7_9GAMM|nr:MAG: Glycosyltransferases involved in cell wall biogenesis [Marinobacter excellens HL-55]
MAASEPLISIITPTFNREHTITLAVESVLAQSYKHWELLIIDDGSQDGTRERLSRYLEDDRIHYYFQDNQGQSIARNLALQRARGAFICFLDSDDLWVPEKLERQVTLMKDHPEVDVLHSDEIMIDEQGRELSRKNMRRYSGRIARQMLVDNSVSINTVMARRECFDDMGGFSGRYGVADDYDIWLRFSARYTFLYVPEYWGYYRVMPDQISSDKERRFAANENIVRDFIEEFGSVLKPSEIRWGLARFYCRKARYFAATGRAAIAWSAVFRALRFSPLDSVVWRSVYRVIFPRY